MSVCPAVPGNAGYAILELETGFMDGWYHLPLPEVQEIARFLDEERPLYQHRVIAQVEPFSIRSVKFLADVMYAEKGRSL